MTRFQEGGASFRGVTGDATSHTKVKEAVFIKSQISKLIHGQAEQVSFSVVLGDFLRAKTILKISETFNALYPLMPRAVTHFCHAVVSLQELTKT